MTPRQLQGLLLQIQGWTEVTRHASTAPWKAATSEHFGQDWHIADLGESAVDGKTWMVTTDGVHASEMLGDPKTDAAFIAEARRAMPILLRIATAFVESQLLEGTEGESRGHEKADSGSE